MINDKFNNDLLPIIPKLLTIHVFNNQDYFNPCMSSLVKVDDLIEFISFKINFSFDITHAYLVELIIKYIDSLFPKENPVFHQIYIFDDGSKF